MSKSVHCGASSLRLVALAILALAISAVASGGLALAQSAGTGTAPGTGVPAVTSGTADAPADASATEDPTLIMKKKTKATAIPPVIADQPPLPLDTGKAADRAPTSPDATAAPAVSGSTAVISVGTGESSPAPAATEPNADEAAPAVDVKMKKPPKHKAAAAADPTAAADATEPLITASTKKLTRKAAAADTSAASPVAGATCRSRSASVNDFGKDGPTADAKRLLDKDIADWSKANGYKNVKVGGKSVSCVQYLNLIVVDEWTCTATAKVCWQ